MIWRSVLQAIQFDVEHVYKSRLEVALHRLQLRSQLYSKPDRSEDAAAMIIEQVMLCHCSAVSTQLIVKVKVKVGYLL